MAISNKINDIEDLAKFCLHCAEQADDLLFGLHLQCFQSAFGIQSNDNMAIHGVSRLRSEAAIGSLYEDDSIRDAQFHGNYPKYSVTIGRERYIAKLGRTNDYNVIALAETASNQIARMLGLNVPDFHLIFWKNRPCFIVKNFLPEGRAASLVHLSNLWPRNPDGSISHDYFLDDLLKLIDLHGGYRAAHEIVHVVLFDYLIGNADRHRGNIGFIHGPEGKTLAPIYDNVTDLGIENEDFLSPYDKAHPSMRMQIRDGRGVSAAEYMKCLLDEGYASSVASFCKRLKRKRKAISIFLEHDAFLTPNLRGAFVDLVSRRSIEILEAEVISNAKGD